jgi:hypothetical protein
MRSLGQRRWKENNRRFRQVVVQFVVRGEVVKKGAGLGLVQRDKWREPRAEELGSRRKSESVLFVASLFGIFVFSPRFLFFFSQIF